METIKAFSDCELLRLLRGGDPNALATLYQRRQRGIYRFALQMSGSTSIAEDITQEVFLVLIHDNSNFDETRGSLNSFLFGVARNHVLRRLQRERFYSPLETKDTDGGDPLLPQALVTKDGPLDELSRTETIESVRKAVLALPERYREVVVLCDLQELSYAETAAVLGCAVGTVRSRLHRGRTLLSNKLRPAAKEETTSAAMNSTRCFA
ncbi:MAG TPA: RNA polymerase sigma factor [Pyrinomonadaceae bacterium]|nr:RNA polymerase sigma factor [Pyrinomonadaceae bacterium]